jgi:hypothetical protein
MPPRAARRDDLAQVGGGMERLLLAPLGHQRLDLGLAHAVLAAIVDLPLLDVAELPLPRRVVHQRDETHQRAFVQPAEFLDGVRALDLAAQVEKVVAAQAPAAAGVGDGVGERGGGAAVAAGRAGVADAERVQHRGDAGGGELGVVRDEGRQRRPEHLRSRVDVPLKVVRVELDEARDEVVALQIERLAALAGRNLDDPSAARGERPHDD